MPDDRPLYRKSDSFEEVRGRRGDAATLRSRLAEFSQTFDSKGMGTHFASVVKRALADVLDPTKEAKFSLTAHAATEMLGVSDDDLARYLFYRYRYEVFPVIHELDDFPPCLQIEPTSRCNYRCVFCYQTDVEFTAAAQGHMGAMDFNLFQRVVDQAQGHCEAITLASRGEPLLCPDIIKMLTYLRGKFLALKINTNASFLDEKMAHALLALESATIVFSADAATEPLYSRLRVHGHLDRVLENVRRFHDLREKYYPRSRVITRVAGVRFTEEQSMDDMEKIWGDLVDQVAFVTYNPWENVYAAPLSGISAPCSDLWRRMFVWWDGRVNPCDVDFKSTLVVGNTKEDNLSRIWAGESYQALRRDHIENRRPTRRPCCGCTVL